MKSSPGRNHRQGWQPKDPALARYARAREKAATLGGIVPIKVRPPASRVERRDAEHATPQEVIDPNA